MSEQSCDRELPLASNTVHGIETTEDERKEACIYCEEVTFSKHYKDGVCHECQKLDNPGRSELEGRFIPEVLTILGIIIGVILGIVVIGMTFYLVFV